MPKTHSNHNQHLPGVPPFASQESRTQLLHKPMAVLPRSANRSTRRHQKSPRLHATTSAALCKSSMWPLSRRQHAAKPRPLRKQHQRRTAKRAQLRQQTAINHPQLPKLRARRLEWEDLSGPHASHKDQFPITPHSVILLHLLLVLQLAVQGFLPEETPMANRPWRQLLRPMLRAVSHNRRASNTRFRPTYHSPNRIYLANQALGSRVHSELNQSSWVHPVEMRRAAIAGRTRLRRLLVA